MHERDERLKKKVTEAIDSNELVQVFRHLASKKKFNLSMDKLDSLMRKMGHGEFTFDVFKVAYDSDPRLQELVKNFDKDQIDLKSSEVDDLPAQDGGDDNTVANMAKSANDLI